MAKPPADQHCMFCDPNPCECHTPKKKAAPKKRSKPSAINPSAPTVQTEKPAQQDTPVQSFDPRAAMRAMIPAPESKPVQESQVDESGHNHHSDLSSRRLRQQDLVGMGEAVPSEVEKPEVSLTEETIKSLDASERRAVFALRSLLAEEEIESCSSLFKDPTLRAEHWKEQNRGA